MKASLSLISIGMSVRNNQTTLRLAVQSIINQTYPNWELLLIDDGSSDETLRVARSFDDERIKIWSDGLSLGLPARLNQAITTSRGEYFARMDGDDISYPERLERQISYLQRHPNVDLVGSWMLVYGPEGRLLGKRPAPEDHNIICARPSAGFPLAHSTFLGRIDFFRRYMYRVSAVRCEDQDLLLRTYRQSVFANVPEILYGVGEQLYLNKLLTSRRFFAKSLFTEFRQQGRLYLAVRAVLEQGLKAMIDIAAIGSGLNYRLLRHRARPVTLTEQERWEQVWADLNKA
jgi:glycosyltransferase involved in cell wall biosynthesis